MAGEIAQNLLALAAMRGAILGVDVHGGCGRFGVRGTNGATIRL